MSKKRRNRRIILLSLVTLVVLAACIILVVLQRRGTFASMTDFGILVEEGEQGGLSELNVDSSLKSQFFAYEGGIAILLPDEFRIYDHSGKQSYYSQISMSDPVLKTGGKVNLIFDQGGNSYLFVNNEKETLNKSDSLPIINGGVNKNGWSALVAQENGYKAKITVFDDRQEEVFYAYSSSRYVLCADVSPSNKTMAAGLIGQEEGEFLSQVVLYSLDREDPVCTVDLGDALLLEARFLDDGTLSVVTEDRLLLFRQKGDTLEQVDELSYNNDYLRNYSLDGSDFACAVVSRFKVGGQGSLVVLRGKNPEEPLTLTVDEPVLALSAAGDRIAVLTASEIRIYSGELELVHSVSDIEDVRSVIMREDGSCLMIRTNSVKVLQ